MIRKKIYLLTIYIVLLQLPVRLFGLGFHSIEIKSQFNHPLVAIIKVTGSNRELGAMSATIESEDSYRRAGVVYSPIVQHLDVKVTKDKNNKYIIVVTSKRSINVPSFNILLRANWGDRKMFREFSVAFVKQKTGIVNKKKKTSSYKRDISIIFNKCDNIKQDVKLMEIAKKYRLLLGHLKHGRTAKYVELLYPGTIAYFGGKTKTLNYHQTLYPFRLRPYHVLGDPRKLEIRVSCPRKVENIDSRQISIIPVNMIVTGRSEEVLVKAFVFALKANKYTDWSFIDSHTTSNREFIKKVIPGWTGKLNIPPTEKYFVTRNGTTVKLIPYQKYQRVEKRKLIRSRKCSSSDIAVSNFNYDRKESKAKLNFYNKRNIPIDYPDIILIIRTQMGAQLKRIIYKPNNYLSKNIVNRTEKFKAKRHISFQTNIPDKLSKINNISLRVKFSCDFIL